VSTDSLDMMVLVRDTTLTRKEKPMTNWTDTQSHSVDSAAPRLNGPRGNDTSPNLKST
jgi:hypothetical protein